MQRGSKALYTVFIIKDAFVIIIIFKDDVTIVTFRKVKPSESRQRLDHVRDIVQTLGRNVIVVAEIQNLHD